MRIWYNGCSLGPRSLAGWWLGRCQLGPGQLA
jgi:hypothetical protein